MVSAVVRYVESQFERRGMGRQYLVGVILVAISAVIWSSAGVFTRGVAADAWSVIFWRGLAAAGFTFVFLVARRRFGAELRMMDGKTVLVTLFMASGTAAFIPAFKLSSVANVAMIWAAAPFVTAGLAWLVLGERPSRRVVLASLATLFGVGCVAWGSLQGGGLWGDVLAGWMTVVMSASFVAYRAWPEMPTAMPAALSSAVLVPVAVLFAEPLTVVVQERWILVAFGAVFAVASVLMLEGARRIPSAEVALLGALETPLAPVLAFLVLAEAPAALTVIGGAIILGAVVWAQAAGLRKATPPV